MKSKHQSINVAIARYGELIDMLVDRSHHEGDEDRIDDALAQAIGHAVTDLVNVREIGVLAGLLRLMGGQSIELQRIATETLTEMGDDAVSAVLEEVTSNPTGVGTPGALLLLALMGTPEALKGLNEIWSRLNLPYPLRVRASRLLTACTADFFDEQRAFVEEMGPDAWVVHDLLELLGGTALSPLFAFRVDWLGSPDNLDFNLALLSLGAFVWRQNEYCALLRTHGFEDECLRCDRLAVDRAIATREPQIYQCYAGLTDIVIPILEDKNVVGTLMTGQINNEKPTPNSFRQICKRLEQLPPGLRKQLETAYLNTPYVRKKQLENIVRAFQVIAHLLYNMWHKTELSLQKTKQLHRLEYFGRRELIETLLFGEIAQKEMTSRLRELGVTSKPNFAMLIRLENLDERTRGEPDRRKMLSFERAALLAADHLEHKADALVAPLRYGEIVGLMESPAARNPHLRRLRQKELAEDLVEMLRDKADLEAVVGIGHVARGAAGLKESFERARDALLYAANQGRRRVVHTDEISPVTSDKVAQFSQLETDAAVAICGEEEMQATQIADRVFALMQVDSSREMSRCIPLLVSIVGSAAELAIEQGAPRASVFGTKLEFLDKVRALKNLSEVATLIADLHRALRAEIARTQVGRVAQRIALARDYLEQHYAENVNREELATHVAMSPWHLTTAFHRTIGMSPRDYLHKIRIESAKKRLITTDDSVEDVAYAVGYGSAANFRRMFNKWVGCSPTTFRRHTDVPNL